MAIPQPGLPDRQQPARPRPARPRVSVKVTLVMGGTGGIAGLLVALFAGHVPFSAQAGVFENLMALIMLTAVAVVAFTAALDQTARARLRYLAGRKAVESAQSHAEALRTLRALNSSASGRWARWWLGLPVVPDEDDEDQAG